MSKAKKPTVKPNTSRLTFTALPTTEQANQEFLKYVQRRGGSGYAYHAKKFVAIMNSVMAMKQSFNRSDIYYYAKPYHFPNEITAFLFDAWCITWDALGKLKSSVSCMDEILWILT